MNHSKLAPSACDTDTIFAICTDICTKLRRVADDSDLELQKLALRERLACGVNTLEQRTINTDDAKYLAKLKQALDECDVAVATRLRAEHLFTSAIDDVSRNLKLLVKVYEDMLLYDDFADEYTEIASSCLRDYMDIVWAGEHECLRKYANMAVKLHKQFKQSFFAFAEAGDLLNMQWNREFCTPFWWFTTDPQRISDEYYQLSFETMVRPCVDTAKPLPAKLQQSLQRYANDQRRFSVDIASLKDKVAKPIEWLQRQGELCLADLCRLPLAAGATPVAAKQEDGVTSAKLFICKNGVVSDINCISMTFFEYAPSDTPARFAAKVDSNIIPDNAQLYAVWEISETKVIKPNRLVLDKEAGRILIEFDSSLSADGHLLTSIFIYD